MSRLDAQFNYKKLQATRARDLMAILEQEGEWTELHVNGATAAIDSTATNTTICSNPSNTAAGGAVFSQPVVGRCMWVESITIECSQDAYLQVGMLGDINGKLPAFNYRTVVKANTPHTVKVRQFWRQRRLQTPSLVLSARDFRSTFTGQVVKGSITMLGYVVTDDLNFYADKTLLVVGDSLDYGDGYGPSKSEKLHTHILRDYFKSMGADVRLLSFAIPGYTSSMVYDEMIRGRYDPFEPSVCIYKIGTNDAVLAAAGFVNTWSANMQAFWGRLKQRAPNCTMVVVPPGPLNDATNEASGALIRARAASDIASLASPRLKCCDIGSAFDRTNTTFFKAGDQIHWSDSGQAAVGSVEMAFMAAQGITC